MSPFDRRSFLKATTAGAAILGACAGAQRRIAREADDDDPLGVRSEFPITREAIYLNTAYSGPLCMPARQAELEYLEDKTLRPAAGRGRERADRARRKFAELVGVKPEEVGLLYSTSDGENVVARALELGPGDNVVLDELHFSTSFVLYRELEREQGVELRIVPQKEGRAGIDDFRSRVDSRTRLVSVAWVSHRNGYRQDVRSLSELAHRHRAFLYVDGIQAVGAFPSRLREEGIDFLATGAYKWLFASTGVAPFFVREEHLDRIHPDRYGHGQVAEELPDFRFRLQPTARKFEYATLATGAVYQLEAVLGYLQSVGLDRIAEHGTRLAVELREGVARLGFETLTPPDSSSPIVSFVHGRDPEQLKRAFAREGIVVSFREKDTQIRASLSMFNNRADVRHFLGVLEQLA